MAIRKHKEDLEDVEQTMSTDQEAQRVEATMSLSESIDLMYDLLEETKITYRETKRTCNIQH